MGGYPNTSKKLQISHKGGGENFKNFSHFFYNPPQKSGPKGRRHKAGGFSAGGPSGRIFEGGLKGKCKKKFIMEVKTVKTRKSTE